MARTERPSGQRARWDGYDGDPEPRQQAHVERAAEPTATVEVPARSLLLALTAGIEDDQRTANGDAARG